MCLCWTPRHVFDAFDKVVDLASQQVRASVLPKPLLLVSCNIDYERVFRYACICIGWLVSITVAVSDRSCVTMQVFMIRAT